MTLKPLIATRIRQSGPMRVSDYMETCLLHPELGYYTTRDPLGTAGDFITAPEISQMFGELIGLCLAQCWLDQGSPAPFTLAELGPGRGTLMADALRATKHVPGFHTAARLTLVEASPVLRVSQANLLAAYNPQWLDTATALPDQPLFLVANEFFDALPIRQFQREGKAWRERMVGLSQDELSLGLGPALLLAALEQRLPDTRTGDIVETCTPAIHIVAQIATRIARHGGAAILVDYGDWRSQGDTLQALKGHKTADIFATPGSADLTAHVDFEPLAQAAQTAGCAFSRLTTQADFLQRLGLAQRAHTLAKAQNPTVQATITSAQHRLTHKDEMGNLFKVLGLYPDKAPPPPGLAP